MKNVKTNQMNACRCNSKGAGAKMTSWLNNNFKLLALTLLAVLSSSVWGYTGTFSAYTNATLIDGYYVIGASTSASNKSYCAGTTVSSGRITGQSLNTSNPSNNYVWIIEETASGWTFNNVGSSTKYIRQKGTSSGGGMEVNTTVGYFTLAGYNSSSPVGFKFTSADQNSTNFFKYNNSSKWFSNYANAYTTSMTPVTLYRDNTKFRVKTTQPGTGSFMASATGATWDATKKHLSWLSSGTTVTLTATPPSGKEVDSWTVTKASGGTVTVSNNSFSMPADQVTISVTWKAAGPSCTTSPTVSAGSVSGATTSSLTFNCAGGITSLGSTGCSITEYGYVYGTSNNPTTSNTKYKVGESYTTTGTAFAAHTATGLNCGTTYYMRPYAINGNGTAYGTQATLATSACPVDHFIDNVQETDGYTGDGKVVSTSFTKASITLSDKAATTSGSCEEVHYHFVGWVTEADRSAGNVDAEHIVNFQDSGNVPTGTTYYAVWAKEDE